MKLVQTSFNIITKSTLFFDKPNLIKQKATKVSYILCGQYYNNCAIKQISILANIFINCVVLFSKSEATKYQQMLKKNIKDNKTIRYLLQCTTDSTSKRNKADHSL